MTVAQELVSKTDKLEGSIVITDHQVNGKGQRGNVWKSEAGKNLTFSLVLKPRFLKAEDQFYLNIITFLAITDSLKEVQSGQMFKLNGPTISLSTRKRFVEYLIENRLVGSIINSSIVGIGLNVNQKQIGYSNATSLGAVMGEESFVHV